VQKIKVLLVDDSSLVRRLVTKELSKDAEIEIVGSAGDGKSGLEKVAQLRPDVIILDVEMPGLDGLGMLKELRKINPLVPVLMFSSLTERGASVTIEALSSGATDYIAKPSRDGASPEAVHEDLRVKVKTLGRRRTGTVRSLTPAPVPSRGAPRIAPGIIHAVAIGVSTGGPNALSVVLPELPEEMAVPIFIVQHMPAEFTRQLAQRLDAKSKIPVVEAQEGMQVKPGVAYIAPGNFHMEVKGKIGDATIVLHRGALENSCRPAVDVLFRSLPPMYQSGVLGVILTGMGQDGVKGCEALVAAGARVIAQDEESSVVWGMPGQVTQRGLADTVLPLTKIAGEVVQRVSMSRAFAQRSTMIGSSRGGA